MGWFSKYRTHPRSTPSIETLEPRSLLSTATPTAPASDPNQFNLHLDYADNTHGTLHVIAGEQVALKLSLQNSMGATQPVGRRGTDLRFYLSSDTAFDSGDTPADALEPFDDPDFYDVILPTITPGTYHILVEITADPFPPFGPTPAYVAAGAALVIENPSTWTLHVDTQATSVAAGQSVSVTNQLLTTANTSAPISLENAGTINYFLSKDDQLDSSDTIPFPGPRPTDGSQPLIIPVSTPPGMYRILAKLTAGGQYAPPGLRSMIAASAPFTVTAGPALPDLVAVSLVQPGPSIPTGVRTTALLTLRNDGNTAAHADVPVSLAVNVRFGSRLPSPITNVPIRVDLKPGQSKTFSISYLVPPGQYDQAYLAAQVNSDAFLTEATDQNNSARTPYMNIVPAFTSLSLTLPDGPVKSLAAAKKKGIRVRFTNTGNTPITRTANFTINKQTTPALAKLGSSVFIRKASINLLPGQSIILLLQEKRH